MTKPIRPQDFRLPMALFLALGLASCVSSDMSDLDAYTAEVLARKGGRIEPLPEIKPYERYLYQSAEGGRDPFEAFFREKQAEAVAKASDPNQQKYLDEIQNRNLEELENYELDTLRMVGTLQDTNELWGIVVDRSGTVHRVKVGNYMGRNYGKILDISEEKIDLREIISDGQGGYQERQASLALVEE
jgi:type IV pilus assembly protein PilP